jgi:protein-tyrosine phosphatase
MKNKLADVIGHTFRDKGFGYDKITEEIFLGTNMCCQYGFDKELLQKGIKADISLEKDKIDAPTGVDYFLWLPTENHQAPTLDALKLGVAALSFLIERKIKVYIHCENGRGRAPTLLGAYLIKNGMSIDEAVTYLKGKRSVVHLNEPQMQALREFERNIKHSDS